MPFQTIKDPDTGEERKVYVAPKAQAQPVAAPQAAKAANPMQAMFGGASPAQMAYDLAGSVPGFENIAQQNRAFGEGIIKGVQEFSKTGDVVKSVQAGVTQAQKAPAPLMKRAMQTALRNTVQELSDVGTDIGGALAGGGGTTAQQPDKPLAGIFPALPKQEAKLGMLEEVTTGLLQLGVQMSGLGFAQAGLSATAAASKIPAIAKAGQVLQQAGKGVEGLQKAQVLGGGLGQAAKGVAKRGVGFYLEGAGKGAIVDFAGFDQHADNISSMVDSMIDSMAGTNLQVPLIEYLRSKPGVDGLTGRALNAIDGFVWGGPAGMAIGAGAAGVKGVSNLLKSTFEFAKAAKDEADAVRNAQQATTQTPDEAAPQPPVNTPVASFGLQARMQDAEQQVRRFRTEIDALGPEPQRPAVKEKSDRATAYRSWTRQANALRKQAAEAASVLSNLTMESGISQAPEFTRVTGRFDLRAPETQVPAKAEEVKPAAITVEEATTRRVKAQEKLRQTWEESQQMQEEGAMAPGVAQPGLTAPTPQPAPAAVAPEPGVPSAGTPAPAASAEPAVAAAKAKLPDTRGQNQFFHGTAQEIKQLDEGYYESTNIYGQGFYATDDLKTAGSYTKKNVKTVAKGGGTPSQVIYQINETQPVKFYDLDAPVSPTVRQQLETSVDYSEATGRALDELDANPEMTLAQVMDEIRNSSKAAGESRDTIQEVFDGVREALQAEGYGGFTHVGGRLTRTKREHQVRIYWDPATQINLQKIEPGISAAEPTAAAPKVTGPTAEEIRQLDENLAIGLADRSAEERVAIRDQLLAQKYSTAESGGAGAPPPPGEVPPAQMGPLPDPDFQAVIDSASTKLEDLKAGRITLEELMRNEVRRFTSPSGRTIYNSRASEELMAFVQSISDNVIDPLTKAEVTGQPSLNMTELHRQAARQMRADGFEPEAINQLVGKAQEYVDLNSDTAAKVRLVRSMQLAVDHLGNETAILALKWKNRNIADVGERGELAQQLIAAYDELSRVYVPYMTIGRQAAQEMRGRQMKNTFDGGMVAMPSGVILRHGTDRAAAQGIIDNGFKAGESGNNLMGEGIYFTTSKHYVSAYGDTEVFGDLPSSVLVLDLIDLNRSVNDIAKEIGIGNIKSTLVDGEPMQFMTQAQKNAFRAWVLDQGYDGVRYDATFSSKPAPGPNAVDEVVIYDLNKANQIVGSKAAVNPPEPPTKTGVELINKEMASDVINLLDKLTPKAQAEITTGQLSEETERMIDVLADGVQLQKSNNKYAAGNFAEKLRAAPTGSLTMDAITQFYISSLLWSDATWYAMLLGGIYKGATKPLVNASGFYVTSAIDLARLDMRSTVRNFRRGNQQWQLYADYQLRLGSAWKLMGMAFETGTSINATMRGVSDYTTPKSLADEQAAARLAGDAIDDGAALKENTINNPFFLDPEANYLSAETFNPLAAAIRAVWKANNVSTRIAASIDTALSHIVVPASEFRRFYVEELERAEDMGLGYGTKESNEFAVRRAQERLDAISRDVYLNGKTVKNGVVIGTAAENVTNWLNFTDDVWISEKEMREQRTYAGGLRQASDRGITDPEEASKFAVEWGQQTPGIPSIGRTASLVPAGWQWAVDHAPPLRLAQAFNRSPANILKSLLRGTPLSPIVDSFWRDINSEIPEIRAGAIGEIVVGSTIAGLLYATATSGLVQFAGSGPPSPDQNRKWRLFLGLTTGPFSMRVKNSATGEWYPWVSMQRLDQIGTIAGFMGDFIDLGNSLPIEEANQLGSGLNIAIALTMRGAKGQFDRTSYQGFKEMIEAVQAITQPLDMEGDRINPAVAMVENIASKLAIPLGGAVRTARRVIDQRRVSVPASNFLQETFDKIRVQIPGQSDDLPGPLHPVTGNEIMAASIWGTQFIPQSMPWLKALYALVTPTSAFPIAQSTNDPVDNELARLQGRGSTFNFFPPTAVNGYRMNYAEHQAFVRMGTSVIAEGRDTNFHEALRQLISSEPYLALDNRRPSRAMESDQVLLINETYANYKQKALGTFLASPIGARAKEEFDKNKQSRIDQSARLTDMTTMDAASQRQTTQPWSPTP